MLFSLFFCGGGYLILNNLGIQTSKHEKLRETIFVLSTCSRFNCSNLERAWNHAPTQQSTA